MFIPQRVGFVVYPHGMSHTYVLALERYQYSHRDLNPDLRIESPESLAIGTWERIRRIGFEPMKMHPYKECVIDLLHQRRAILYWVIHFAGCITRFW